LLPFPVGDENPTSRRPVVNLALIAVNGACFLWFNVLRGHGFFEMTPADLNAWGLRPGDPAPSRFLTAMFLHAGPMHLFGNMWFLHIFGDNVEDKLGRGKYLLLYLLWGVAASLAFLQFGRPQLPLSGAGAEELERAWLNLPLIGASGAIAGVMGAYLVFFPRARIRVVWWLIVTIIFRLWPAILVIGMFFLQDFILAAVQRSRGIGGVAYAAHVGGMVAGVVAALVLKPFLPKGGGVADSAWDRDTGFTARNGPAGGGNWGGGGILDRSGLPDLRDQIVGAVLDGRMELAVDLYREWARTPGAEALPAAVEMEIAHEIVRLGRVEEASAAYRRYLERNPKGAEAAEAKFRLGLIHARVLGDREAARSWLRMAADEHPDPETVSFARRELARLERGG
jgi:membrane associated rhomboid family serine protease